MLSHIEVFAISQFRWYRWEKRLYLLFYYMLSHIEFLLYLNLGDIDEKKGLYLLFYYMLSHIEFFAISPFRWYRWEKRLNYIFTIC